MGVDLSLMSLSGGLVDMHRCALDGSVTGGYRLIARGAGLDISTVTVGDSPPRSSSGVGLGG
jgi:hypothetical protein